MDLLAARITHTVRISLPASTGFQLTLYSASIPPRQAAEYSFGASPRRAGTGATETTEFVLRKIETVLQGGQVNPSEPPPIELSCTHLAEVSRRSCCTERHTQVFCRAPILFRCVHLPLGTSYIAAAGP